MNSIPVVAYEKANVAKGEYPEGFADGVSISVIASTARNGTSINYRALRSAGSPWSIGETVDIVSDQSRRDLGRWTVVGQATPDTGVTVGEVPNRKIPLWNVK